MVLRLDFLGASAVSTITDFGLIASRGFCQLPVSGRFMQCSCSVGLPPTICCRRAAWKLSWSGHSIDSSKIYALPFDLINCKHEFLKFAKQRRQPDSRADDDVTQPAQQETWGLSDEFTYLKTKGTSLFSLAWDYSDQHWEQYSLCTRSNEHGLQVQG